MASQTKTRSRKPAKRTVRRSPKAPPTAAELRALKLSPEVAQYLIDRKIKLPSSPPAVKTPEPRNVRGAEFHYERVDEVLRVFGLLVHTQGQWAGRPLKPDAWQVAYILAPVFGWVRWDRDSKRYVRIIRELYVEVPRKNGKTTLFGGIALYLTCADHEVGAQVIAAATGTKQARFLFDPVKQIAKRSPALRPYVKPMATKIVHNPSGSYLEAVSSVADALHGGNVHGGVVDELHLHKSPDLIEAIETGTGSRTQPLVAAITTADEGKTDTIYARKRDYVEKLDKRVLKDPATYGVIWCADEEDDPFAVATLKKANPGYGVSPTRSYLRGKIAKARQSPADLATYLRLHLGIRKPGGLKYINLGVWDRNAGLAVDWSKLKNRQAYGGLDLSATTDLTSLCWIVPDGEGGYDVVWRHWCPERAYAQLCQRTADSAKVWRREGWLTVTDGDTVDYGVIQAQINKDREHLDVVAIGYDRWNASQLVIDLEADEAPMVKLGQGFASLSAPLKQINHVLLTGSAKAPKFRHGGNPIMRWQTDNLTVSTDAAGNVKPDKAKAPDKIDGWSAAVDAMAMEMANEPETSAYDDDGLMVV